MVAPEGGGVDEGDEAVDEHCKRDAVGVYGVCGRRVVLGLPRPNVCGAGGEEVDSQQRARRDECVKVAVVTPTHAVIQPHAMVVLRLDAVVAYAAVVAARGAPDVTRFAVFCGDFEGAVLRDGGFDNDPVGG